jgi:GDPmannose 4,6-dehydratase
VTRKSPTRVARIKLGMAKEVAWATRLRAATGVSPATTSDAMWRMLQQDEADDYVIGRDTRARCAIFVQAASGVSASTIAAHVVQDPRFLRPRRKSIHSRR